MATDNQTENGLGSPAISTGKPEGMRQRESNGLVERSNSGTDVETNGETVPIVHVEKIKHSNGYGNGTSTSFEVEPAEEKHTELKMSGKRNCWKSFRVSIYSCTLYIFSV